MAEELNSIREDETVNVMPDKWLFLQQRPDVSTGDRELELSVIKAHIMRRFHAQRRKVKHRKVQTPVLSKIEGISGTKPVATLLDQSTADPFNTMSTDPVSRLIQQAINWSYDNFWPRSILSPDDVGQKLCLIERRTSHPFWFHTSISQASAIWLNLNPNAHSNTRQSLIALRRKHTLKALQMMIQLEEGPESDAYSIPLTYGAFRLSVQAGIYDQHALSVFPTSPLAKVQHLHVYGSMDILPGFTESVVQRIQQWGGLKSFAAEDRMPTARILLFADIIVATRRDTLPLFEWPFPLDEDRIIGNPSSYALDMQARSLHSKLGRNFFFEKDLDWQFLLSVMVEATVAVDHLHRNTATAPKVWQVGRARNLAQFSLCSMKPLFSHINGLENRPHTKKEILVKELCRLAMLIFSDFVLFPIPEVTDVKPNLLEKLKAAWIKLPAEDDHELRDLMTWVVILATLAAIASKNSEVWYMTLFWQRVLLHGFTQNVVQKLKDIAERFLWWEIVLDPRLHDACSRTIIDCTTVN